MQGAWFEGQFKTDFEFVRGLLDSQGIEWKRTHLIKGWFRDTLTADLLEEFQIRKTNLIFIDCDMYLSAKEALDFCAPLIKDRCVIVFDDWASNGLDKKDLGEKKAFEEFLAENPRISVSPFGRYACKDMENGRIFQLTVS